MRRLGRRRRGQERKRLRATNIVKRYLEAALDDNPDADDEEIEMIVSEQLATDFEGRPFLQLLFEVLRALIPLLLDGLGE